MEKISEWNETRYEMQMGKYHTDSHNLQVSLFILVPCIKVHNFAV